jgi:citronellol/citronellal dehydrogenase
LCVLGLAAELQADGIAVNALWPRTIISTAAIEFALGGPEALRRARKPEILADAAYVIFNQGARQFTGNFLIDDTLLYENGVRDFDRYRVDPTVPLALDLYVPEDAPLPPTVSLAPLPD